MSDYSINKEYETIINAFKSENLLEATQASSSSNIHFEEVGYAGRAGELSKVYLQEKMNSTTVKGI